ncbi:MAG: hypothetical protein U9O98_04810 [Asgard group archaeon]|nr:hypothetical protein [Asgard group archaeon]
MTTNNFRKSDSIEYALTKWYDEIVAMQSQYTKPYERIVKNCSGDILQLGKNLQKNAGKKQSKSSIKTKEQLIEEIKCIIPEINEFIDFIYNYITLVEEIEGFELDLDTPEKLISLFKSNIDTFEELKITLRDLIKSANVAFKKDKKPKKELEETYENHLKRFNKKTKEINSEHNKIFSEFKSMVDELNNEVSHAKKIGEEKIA